MPPQGAYWDTPLLDSDPPIIGRPPSRGRPGPSVAMRPSGLGGQGLRSWCAFTVLKHIKVHFSLGPVDTKSKIPQCLRRHAERGTGPRSTVPFEYRPESPQSRYDMRGYTTHDSAVAPSRSVRARHKTDTADHRGHHSGLLVPRSLASRNLASRNLGAGRETARVVASEMMCR